MGLVAWITVATANVSSIKIGLKNSVPSSEVQRHIKRTTPRLQLNVLVDAVSRFLGMVFV